MLNCSVTSTCCCMLPCIQLLLCMCTNAEAMAIVTQIAIFVLPFLGATDCYPGDASCCVDSTVIHAPPTACQFM